MKPTFKLLASTARWTLLAASFVAAVSSSALTIPNAPLSSQITAKPLIMLAMGKDHRLFYEAYNDASDIDGDGTLDIRFKPSILYLGLFDSNVCYTHNDKNDGDGVFTPSSAATGALRTCSGKWAGNWLNYITTSRMDALKVVLYGGTREVDTNAQTILRRTYIPADAHSWGKEYTSSAVDKYLISDYTPLAQPTGTNRHFFGNLTPNIATNCATLDNCSENQVPLFITIQNSPLRIWEWASTERPVLNGSAGGTRSRRTVRVEVCTANFNTGCKLYPNGKYKPVGLLHDFGESGAALFGLITGSYDQNFSGGRLRKVMDSFGDEVSSTDGTFTANATIVKTINSLRIRDFNNGLTNGTYRGEFNNLNRVANEGERVDWGNPISEIMYEATRYLSGKGSATSAYNNGVSTVDEAVGLPLATWDNPYNTTSSKAKAPYCARANLLTISDLNTSFDSDQLPGVNTNFGTGITNSDLSGKSIVGTNPTANITTTLNVSSVTDFISANQPEVTGLKFIGQSGINIDSAPSPKNIASLSSIRGLAPEEPTKRGSYYAAAVANYAKVNDLQPTLKGNQTIDNFFVALASPIPRIEAKLPNGRVINVVPFAKSVGGGSISNTKGNFQPTNQIVDFYVESIANSGAGDTDNTINSGRYQAKFRINFEDVEQGADHDMDAIVEYVVTANADNTLDVRLTPIFEAGGINHRMGYIISGTTNDGVHLVVQDSTDNTPYYLSVPPNRSPGYCDATPSPAGCGRLPSIKDAAPGNSSFTNFTSSAIPAASFLKDPLWYAAKWGGFIDNNNNGQPDLQSEWDKDGDGVPDTYFFVQNPVKLKESLKNAFQAIIERNGSSSNLATNSSRLDSNSRIYQATFTAGKWTGDVSSYAITANGIGNTALWNSQDLIPPWAQRKIYMHLEPGSLIDTSVTAFTSLPSGTVSANFVNEDVYKYIRGDKSKEASNGGAYRNREYILGDIIHSSPNFDPEKKNLYVGANDGMLHTFDSDTGVEKFAFSPREVQARLKNLANTAFTTNHEYYVDGDVSLAFQLAQTNNNKYVYSLLGRGGKGLASINVTGSGTATVPSLLWEYTPNGFSAGTVAGAAAADTNLGLMLGRPVFAKLNNGDAALIVGNGYNSTDGKAVLYLFIINPNGSLKSVNQLDTGAAGDNGLGGPAFIDTDNNGTADYVYAGDLKGNLWKFDISGVSPASWSVAYSGAPLFKAKSPLNEEQPITAPLFVAKNAITGDPNSGKYFIFFGTGSYFQSTDPANLKVQSWYGIIDGILPITSRTELKERTITSQGDVAGREVRIFSQAVANDMVGKKGWYLDLNTTSTPGERIVFRSQILPAVEPALLVSSLFPITGDPCAPGGDGYLNLVSPFTGGAIQANIVDVNGDGKFDAADQLGGAFGSSFRVNIGIPTTPIFVPNNSGSSGSFNIPGLGLSSGEAKRYLDGNGQEVTGTERDCERSGIIAVGGSDGRAAFGVNCKSGGALRGRVSWREILKD
jgi:type IV pilus assembly protein PilY1